MNEQNIPQTNEPIKSVNNLRIIVVSVVATALIVGGGVYSWQRSNLKYKERSLQQQITSLQNQISQLNKAQCDNNQQIADNSVQQNENQSTGVTSDYLVYKNLGFEVSYPNTWIIDKSYEPKGVILLKTKDRQADLDADKMVRAFDVKISVYNNVSELPNNAQDKLSFAEWISQKADTYGFVERSPIIIDGVSGYKGVSNGMIYGNYMQFVENKGKIYQIEIEGISTEEKMSIVNSFRFAE